VLNLDSVKKIKLLDLKNIERLAVIHNRVGMMIFFVFEFASNFCSTLAFLYFSSLVKIKRQNKINGQDL